MTAPTAEPLDGGMTVDLPIAWVMLRYREAVAQATERACRELRAEGVADPGAVLLGRWPPREIVRRTA